MSEDDDDDMDACDCGSGLLYFCCCGDDEVDEDMTEYEIHKAVVQHFRIYGHPQAVGFHVPNGGSRHPAEAANLKRLGVTAGVPDLLFFHRHEHYGLELKSEKGRLSENQVEFADKWLATGGRYYCAYGLDDALEALKQWGLLTNALV